MTAIESYVLIEYLILRLFSSYIRLTSKLSIILRQLEREQFIQIKYILSIISAHANC